MASKLTKEDYSEGITYILKNRKERKFRETIELQIGLKDYDPKKDKRFSGTIRLPNATRDNIKICVIGDQAHCEEAAELGLDTKSMDDLKKFNKNKKDIKKWAKKYDLLLATDTLSRKIPKVCGPTLNKIGMFPQVITHKDPLKDKVNEIKTSVKFQLKKVLCMAVAIGNDSQSEDELRTALTMSVNFLISLLKKQWNNVKSLTIKTTMGKPYKLFG
jgi:large subunit ribosomal protein L10Ae